MKSTPPFPPIPARTPRRLAPLMALGSVLVLGAAGAASSHTPPSPEPGSSRSGEDGQDNAPQSRVILITGSTDGLGREVALELAEPGTLILVHGRNRERGEEVVRAIQEAGGNAHFHQADLADMDQVKALGETLLREHGHLDVLINNAGIWLSPEGGRQVNDAGHEMHFAVNYLSHYALTHTLLPLLRAAPAARIINVASIAQRPLDFGDVMLENDYSDGRAYAQSKLAQILFTVDLAEELEGTGILVTALHPATMMNTSMVLSRGAQARASVEEGVEAVMQQVRSPDLEGGQYFNGLQEARAHEQAYDAEARRRLRELSREWTGVP
jgi:NAD(P)-dependent dehydrogenase (short-subunit alcohol dehydrogenase family)